MYRNNNSKAKFTQGDSERSTGSDNIEMRRTAEIGKQISELVANAKVHK